MKQTILIIENSYEDAENEIKILNDLIADPNYEITKLFDAEDRSSMQNLYNGNQIKEKVLEKIKECSEEEKPVIGVFFDPFLSTKEEECFRNGDYYAGTAIARDIFEKIANIEKNGTLNSDSEQKNIMIISKFPQFVYYAEELFMDEKWARFYENKGNFFDVQAPKERLLKIKKVLTGGYH